jgi:hypothetical protein
MKQWIFSFICLLGVSFSYANSDMACSGDLGSITNPMWSDVLSVEVKYVGDELMIKYVDSKDAYHVNGYTEPGLITYHLMFSLTKEDNIYTVIVELISMEGKVYWAGEFLSDIKCRYLN